MKILRVYLLSTLLLLLAPLAVAAAATMRVDYYHTGDAKNEIFSLDRIVIEPLPWPGNLRRTIDETNSGKYIFEVRNRGTNRLLYSRGFSSIFGEWEITEEAKHVHRTFSESLRFPAPEAPVQIVLKKRAHDNSFVEVWSTVVDPKDKFIDASHPASPAPLIALEKNGDSADKVDFLIIGDGYSAAEEGKCERDARRLTDIMFATSPYKERRKDFNVWLLCPPAAESGISRPSNGIHRRNPVGSTYDAFDSERYVLTFDNHAFREIAQFAPYEFVEILVNGNTYGGGGIFGLYSTVAADSLWAPYIFVHEFGHHFADLADEYYLSDVAYLPPQERVEPHEPNVTALLDPANLKWKDLVQPGTPIPTPWDKEKYEAFMQDINKRRRQIRKEHRSEQEMNALLTEAEKGEHEILSAEKYAGKVGAFEGADYQAKGYYRPEVDCIVLVQREMEKRRSPLV
jgi:IgA Peptidase M64/Peptidase M64 N-terminus